MRGDAGYEHSDGERPTRETETIEIHEKDRGKGTEWKGKAREVDKSQAFMLQVKPIDRTKRELEKVMVKWRSIEKAVIEQIR